MKTHSIVFFGNGHVAAASLKKLSAWADIELVITKTKPPHHKEEAPVEALTRQLGLRLEYANNKKELDNLIYAVKPHSPAGLVIDYGVIISQQTIDYFTSGIINSHFSLLPEWRGADPITFSILSGQPATGVSLMLIDSGLDTGPIIASQTLAILKQTSSQLTEQLIDLSDRLLQGNLHKYLEHAITPLPQPTNAVVTHSRMLTKQDGVVDCSKPASVLEREIRAFQGWPGSVISVKGQPIAILEAEAAAMALEAGSWQVINKELYLGCQIGALKITRLKPSGKKAMDAQAFLNGYSYLLA